MTSRSGTGSGNITGTLRHIYSDKLSLEVKSPSIDSVCKSSFIAGLILTRDYNFSFHYANSWERQC